MSSAARKWLDKQAVEDATLRHILKVLADEADTEGACQITQAKVAKRTSLEERTVRRSIILLESVGMLSRSRPSAWHKIGRASDHIYLTLNDVFNLNRDAILAARKAGATGHKVPLNSGEQPDLESASPRPLPIRKTIYGKHCAENSPGFIYSSRVWWDVSRSKWRARFRLNGIELDLGRFGSKEEAEDDLAISMSDVKFTSTHRSGSPVNAVKNPSLQNLSGRALHNFLVGERLPSQERIEGSSIRQGMALKATPSVGAVVSTVRLAPSSGRPSGPDPQM
ncbi:hypothetical protein [Phyllobacterium sp. 22552]|uniref:hypothetical protein n=1 Tax=Phyllobacterium sp. 22552 TaxID=3453941 RepID=UPI003F85DA79